MRATLEETVLLLKKGAEDRTLRLTSQRGRENLFREGTCGQFQGDKFGGKQKSGKTN